LEHYSPTLTQQPPELERFWNETLAAYQRKPLNATMEKTPTPMIGVEAYHVTYEGFDDTPIHGWYLIPAFFKQEHYPCIVIYQGYSGDKGLPERYAAWLLLGYAVFAVDARGQGGETGNRLTFDTGVRKGWVSQNITHKNRCYYLALAIDSVKAVDWVAARREIDPRKIAVMGGSQGGGSALLTSALSLKVSLVIADIPNMCHLDFGMLNSIGSVTEISEYVKRYPETLDAVLNTLSYFDIMNLAYRIQVPVRMSVGLKDPICCPEMIFAAYNRIESEKHIDVFPFSGHEVGEELIRQHMRYLETWKSS
jgi:cephalosporin-C deacetylase